MDLFSPEQLLAVLGDATNSQLMKNSFLFALAAIIHSGRVKKEIREQMTLLTDAIRDEARSVRKIVESHANEIAVLKQDVQELKKT